MPYVVPEGWVERLGGADEPLRMRFHTRQQCVRIVNVADLVPVVRPGSAARCPACAAVA